jgi:hypothetical protein
MFLRCSTRKNNGKPHRYWSLVENKRCAGHKVVQRHMLYLGEINPRQEVVWREAAAAFPDAQPPPRTGALFAAERALEAEAAGQAVRVKLTEMALRRPRPYGACWDKRPDCVQVVLALIVTPEGFPLAYEVMPGHTADKTTLKDFLARIETLYGKAQRIGGHGSRRCDRGDLETDARKRSARARRGGHAQGPAHAAGAEAGRAAVGAGARRSRGEAA